MGLNMGCLLEWDKSRQIGRQRVWACLGADGWQPTYESVAWCAARDRCVLEVDAGIGQDGAIWDETSVPSRRTPWM